MDQSRFTIIIPSKIIDRNLINCEKKIRQYYKEIKILLALDEINDNTEFSVHTNKIVTGLVNVSEKRNMCIKLCKTDFLVFIDSDAYPDHPWLDKIESIFEQNENIGACGGPNLSPDENDEEKKLISFIKKSYVVTQDVHLLKKIQSKGKFIHFLPTCNLIIKKSIIKNEDPFDKNLFSNEEISLNMYIKKFGYKIYYDPSLYIFHKDRNINSYLRQRFIYGSEALKVFVKFPCKCSFNLVISTIPFISILLLTCIFFLSTFNINIFILNTYLFPLTALVIFLSMIIIIFETCRIFLVYKKKLFQIFVLLTLSVFVPGLGQVMKPFLSWKSKRKIWIQ